MIYLTGLCLAAGLIASLPWLISRYAMRRWPQLPWRPAPVWLPAGAGLLLLIGFYLPHVPLGHGQTYTFPEHFVGGGLMCSLLYLYLENRLGRHWPFIISVMGLFAFTSSLGVANELFEFALSHLHIASIDTADTSWDLVANTLGGIVGYLAFRPFIRSINTHKSN